MDGWALVGVRVGSGRMLFRDTPEAEKDEGRPQGSPPGIRPTRVPTDAAEVISEK